MPIYTSIDALTLERIRADQTNVNGTPAAPMHARGGEPVRCCLTDAEPGEALLLVGIDLRLPSASPYAGTSPVYVHTHAGCTSGPRTAYPEAWRGRRQVLRGYDENGWIVAATEHDGTAPDEAIDTLLARPDVAQVLSSNVLHGCFMFRVTRD